MADGNTESESIPGRIERAIWRADQPCPIRLLTVTETAGVLRVSGRTVRRLIAAGELRAVALRTKRMTFYRISVDALRAFVEAAERAARPEAAVPALVEIPARNY